MNLKSLWQKAKAAEDEPYNDFYDFADEITPTIVLKLIEDRDRLRAAAINAVPRIVAGTPAWIALSEAIAKSDETFPD